MRHGADDTKSSIWNRFFLALAGAVILVEGSVFGESTTAAGIVIGVIGIVLIATSKVRLLG
jgi:hypothetical protein